MTTVRNLGSVGVISDPDGVQIPKEGWTNASNIRFVDNGAEKVTGHDEKLGTPSDAPYTLMSYFDGSTGFWGYASLNAVWATDENVSAHADLTRLSGPYSANAQDRWHTGIISQKPYWYNGNDLPQIWDPPNLVTKLIDMPNWPAGVNCHTLRSWRGFLIMLNVDDNGVLDPSMVWWSNLAPDEQTIPQDWDYADPTSLSRRQPLAQSQDDSKALSSNPIIDGLPLGDQFIIYRQRSIWSMQFLNDANRVFRFSKLNNEGLLNRGCVAQFERKHCFMTPSADVFVHDGVSAPVSIMEGRIHKRIAELISAANIRKVFMFANSRDHEIEICIPEAGQTVCTVAAVWNWRNNTWSFKTLDHIQDKKLGGFDASALVIDDITIKIDDWRALIDADLFAANQRIIVQARPGGPKLLTESSDRTWNGTPFKTLLERTDIPLGDSNQKYMVGFIRPEATGDAVVNFYVALSDYPGAPLTYEGPHTFDFSTPAKVLVRQTGRYLSIRIEDLSSAYWRLSGLSVEAVKQGMR